MNDRTFIERVAETCKREVYFSPYDDNFAVQRTPNPYDIQLRYSGYGPGERVAEVYIPKTDKWLLLFWNEKPQFQDHAGCCYHLQENTDIDGPEGIIDHKFSKTLAGCLNALERLLNE